MKIKFYVKPGSRRNEVSVNEAGEYRVMLSAPPVDGKANTALIKFISEIVQVPPTRISLLKGHTARHKLLEIPGDEKEILKRLIDSASK